MVAFVISRVAIRQAGLIFDLRPLNNGFQLLGVDDLRRDLLGSLLHLHQQPPLYNLFIGLAVRAPLGSQPTLFEDIYLIMGVVLALALYAVLLRLRLHWVSAAALAVLFTISPSALLYENWLLYDYLVTLLVVLTVFALLRYVDGERLGSLALFVSLLAVLVLTRSLFQLAWLLLWVVVLVVRHRRRDWRRVVLVSAVPVLAVLAVYANTLRIAGSFTSSTSFGIGLAKITTFQLPVSERRAMVNRGELSPLALIPPFKRISAYDRVVPPGKPTGIPVLDEELKHGPGSRPYINFNNLRYAQLSSLYLKDAVRTVRRHPEAYLKGMEHSFTIYFRPSSDFFALARARQSIADYTRHYNTWVYGVTDAGLGQSRLPSDRSGYDTGPARTAWTVLLLYLAALLGGGWELARAWRSRRGPRLAGPHPLVVAFLWSTIGYITLVSNLFEIGENSRFRLYADPLALALVGSLISGWVRRRRRSRTGQPG